MEKIRLLVVDDIAQTRKDIARLLYFEDDMEVVGEAADGVEALEKTAALNPDVVLMDINMPTMDGITATEKLTARFPGVAVVIISIQGESEYLKKAMFAGASDYLVKPLGSEEMAATIRRVYRKVQEKKAAVLQVETPVPKPEAREVKGEAGYAPNREPAVPPAARNGSVYTLFCGKGGVGKTTLAVNLAVVLGQNGRKKVALLDMDLQFGDIAVMLNLTEGKTVSELAREAEITPEVMKRYLIRHFSGVDIIPAPLMPQEAEYVRPEHVEAIIRILKQEYDYIVVDTAPSFHEINLVLTDLSDRVLMMTTRDIATIKNTKVSLDIMDSLGYRDKIWLILNRSDQDLGVEVADLEKGLEITVTHMIPADEKAVISAINKGVPLVLSHQSAEIAKSLCRLGEKILNPGKNTGQARGTRTLLNRLFSL